MRPQCAERPQWRASQGIWSRTTSAATNATGIGTSSQLPPAYKKPQGPTTLFMLAVSHWESDKLLVTCLPSAARYVSIDSEGSSNALGSEMRIGCHEAAGAGDARARTPRGRKVEVAHVAVVQAAARWRSPVYSDRTPCEEGHWWKTHSLVTGVPGRVALQRLPNPNPIAIGYANDR